MLRDLHFVVGGGRPLWSFFGAVAVSALLQVAAVVTLYPLLGELFSADPGGALPWLALLLLFVVCSWGVDIFAAHRGLDLGIAVMREIHGNAPGAVLSWPDARLTSEKEGAIRDLITKASTVTSAVILLIGPLITSIVFIFGLGVGLLLVSPALGAVTFLGGIACLGSLWASAKLEDRSTAEYAAANAALDDRLFEFALVQPTLRTARRVDASTRLVDRAIAEARRKTRRVLLWQIPGQQVFTVVVQLVLLAFGFTVWWSYDRSALTGAAAAASIVVLLRVVEQANVQAGSVGAVVDLRRSLTEVRELMEVERVRAGGPGEGPATVELRGVDVTFPDGTTGLDGIDVDFAPGTITAVVGPSGSGKSTLVSLLAGLTVPDAGTVDVDGKTASPGDLRGRAAMVFQRTVLHTGSIRENLLAVNPDLTQPELDAIAVNCGLAEAIERLPEGWDTPVGELGNRLSGGERQRLGLARALAKPASVLLVDEGTSALDGRSERTVTDALSGLRGSYTTVVVAHRPAMVEIADRVIVMESGRVVEAGPIDELERADGPFARIAEQWREAATWGIGEAQSVGG